MASAALIGTTAGNGSNVELTVGLRVWDYVDPRNDLAKRTRRHAKTAQDPFVDRAEDHVVICRKVTSYVQPDTRLHRPRQPNPRALRRRIAVWGTRGSRLGSLPPQFDPTDTASAVPGHYAMVSETSGLALSTKDPVKS